MAKVLGVGGVFVRSADPEALRGWYARVLGLAFESWGGVMFPPLANGVTVWSAFPEKAKQFAPSEREVMLNFVVDDLPGVLARAADEGVLPVEESTDEQGRFASIVDLDGRKIELWEPKAEG